MEISSMASMMDLHREAYLKVVLQMFLFLKNKPNGVTFFNPTNPDVNNTQFQTEDFSATPCSP